MSQDDGRALVQGLCEPDCRKCLLGTGPVNGVGRAGQSELAGRRSSPECLQSQGWWRLGGSSYARLPWAQSHAIWRRPESGRVSPGASWWRFARKIVRVVS